MHSEEQADAKRRRLEALWASGLLEDHEDHDFVRISEMATRMLDVSACLISLVDENRQVFRGGCDPGALFGELREMPLSDSFCRHAVERKEPLVVPDAREHPLLAGHGAVHELGVIAYLGFPLIGPGEQLIGTFCVIDREARHWTPDEVELMRSFTALVAEQIELRMLKRGDRSVLDVLVHDLKSPLSGVRMVAAELAAAGDAIPEYLRPLVEALCESTERALEVVESIGRNGKRGVGEGSDMHEVVVRAGDHFAKALEAKGLGLDVEGCSEPILVITPRWIVEQVVENLLSNAVKYSPVGGRIRISVGLEDGFARFEIRDEGAGFSEPDRKRLFQRYAQLSAVPTGGEPSTGLGLSIVKRMVDQEHGSIELLSEPGEGAHFRVRFPMG